MNTYVPNDIKDKNRQAILDLIVQKDRVSKAELNELTRLSFVTISKIVNFFLDRRILIESGDIEEGQKGLGRKRVVYTFNPNAYFTIGIELISETLTAVLLNLRGEVVKRTKPVEAIGLQDESFIKELKQAYEQLNKRAKELEGEVIGVGVAVDGAFNHKEKKVRIRVDHTTEEEVNYEEIRDQLSAITELPILFENDVNAEAVSEFESLDADKGKLNNLITLYLGLGIGSGVIIDQKLHKGSRSNAGELEYLCFDPDYEPKPSNIGWLESKIGKKALEERFQLNFGKISETNQANLILCEDYLIKYLSLTLVSLITIYGIHTVVLSGDIYENFSRDFKDRLTIRVAAFLGEKVDIYFARTQNSSAIGAALLSLEAEIQNIVS